MSLQERASAINDTSLHGADGRHSFAHYRLTSADIVHLPRLVGRPTAVLAELLPVIGRLNRQPAGTYLNAAALYAALGASAQPSSRAIAVLRNFFIDSVDCRLQALYRQHLRANPPPPGAGHDRKIGSLEATREQAQAIVNSYDWDWLADWLHLDRIGENAESCVRRLSNFAFPVQRVNFRFTYHCNIECRHCYNSSGPDKKRQHIPLEPMLAIIAQMPDVGIGHLNLTGGEPFLYPDHLTALIAAGRAAGLRGISIYTNGFWAATAARATQALERLSAVGFMQGPQDHIKMSTGIYHQEFVGFDRVLTLARIYHAMFGRRLRVDCEVATSGDDTEGQVRREVNAAGLTDRVDLSFRGISTLGRGKNLDAIAKDRIDAPCNDIYQIVFDPDGSARPCCGLNNENHGVLIGQLETHRLDDLVKRMQSDPILQFLATNPMSAIFDHVKTPRNADGYTSPCHLCQDAIGGLTDKEPLQAELFGGQKFYPFWFTLSERGEAVVRLADEPSQDID